MATVRRLGADHWEVHMGSMASSEVKVNVHMSKAMADQLAARETKRLRALNQHCDVPEQDLGTAVLMALGLFATTGRI